WLTSSRLFGEGLAAFASTAHVGLHVVETASQDASLLAGVRRDGRGGAGRAGTDGVAEPQPGTPGGGFDVEPPPRSRIVGVGGAPPEGVRSIVDIDDARDRPLADHATSSSTISVMSSGMTRISLILASSLG